MRITIWGCRGSVPTPGPQTIRYGGNTTCVEVRLADGTLIILDAGSGIRNLGNQLLAEEPGLTEMHVFLTHAHWDHLIGFPFFRPAYSAKYTLHMHGGPSARFSLENYLKRQMEAPYFPVPFDVMNARFDFAGEEPTCCQIGEATVTPVHISHPQGGYGFKIEENGRAFVFIPDNEFDYPHEGGLARQDYVEFCRGADLLLHDAQYTDEQYRETRNWGHSTVRHAVELAMDAGVRQFGLFHHDPDHSDDEVDRLVEGAQAQIAAAGSTLDCFGTTEGLTVVL